MVQGTTNRDVCAIKRMKQEMRGGQNRIHPRTINTYHGSWSAGDLEVFRSDIAQRGPIRLKEQKCIIDDKVIEWTTISNISMLDWSGVSVRFAVGI